MLEVKPQKINLSKRFLIEFKRKVLHLFALTIPLTYTFFGWKETLFFVFLCLVGSFLAEIVRLYIRPRYRIPHEDFERLAKRFDEGVQSIAREEEKKGYAAHIYFFTATLIIIALFEKDTAIVAILSSLLGDAAAAIVGISVGRNPLPYVRRKTWEGTIAGTTVALLSAIPFVSVFSSITTALVFFFTDFIDLQKFYLNDNLVTPLLMSLALYASKIVLK